MSVVAALAIGLALGGAAPPSGAPASGPPPPADSIAARVHRYLSARTEMGGFSGAVLIARGGSIVLRRGYGFSDLARRIPYTPETRHEVASISKMFTAMAALKLRDEGRLALSDSIARWLKDCPDAWRGVTVKELIRHTSGIPDYEEVLEIGSEKYFETMTRPDAVKRIVALAKTLPLDFPPGTKFHYSNTGYIVLSMVVQAAAREPFERFVRDRLLRPAGMSRSGVFDGVHVPEGLAVGYTRDDLGWARTLAGVPLDSSGLRPVPRLPLTPPEGDAGIYSTVDDLYRWSRIMDGSRLVPDSLAAEAFTPGLSNYGAGWFIGRGFDRRRMRHNGSLPGYVSDFIRFPDDSVTIVLFSNLDRARLDRIARDVSAIVLGTPYDPPVRGRVVTLTAEQIAVLEGDFRMPDGKLLTIRNAPDYLTAKLTDAYTAGLIPLSPLEFYFPLGDGRALFTLDAGGRAVRVNMRYGGEDHVAERVAVADSTR